MPSPLVSVILPVKNGGETLRETVESILGQSAALELIVVLSPSNDSSSEILGSFGERITLLPEHESKGVYAAMNTGIQASRGEWIYFIGADDKLKTSGSLQQLIDQYSGSELLLYGDVNYTDISHGGIPEVHQSSFDHGLYWKNTLHHQSCLYHRACFDKRQFDEHYKILGDYEFNLYLLNQKAGAKHVGRVVADCRAGGLSKNFNAALYLEELKLKRTQLPLPIYLLNIPWVMLKYLYKKISS